MSIQPTAPGGSDPPSESSAIEMAGITLRPGDHIDAYRYEYPIGKGGMAHVLLARDPDGNAVALKVLMAHRFRTGLTRFRREFHALARLKHENIIRVESCGDIHGHPYIAMEFVKGTDLHTTIRNFPRLPPAERFQQVEDLLVDLTSALAHIHRRGLIHRDLKPSNVLVTEDGVAKITDFGIVKDLDPASDPQISTTLVGTWAYASPEQISGETLDHRSDLYSLGVMLFTMLTGRRPFVAKDMGGYLELHRDQAPPRPSDFEPGIPPHLEEICLRLLRKSPKDRYQSAQEILFRLEQLDPKQTTASTLHGTEVWEPPFVGRKKAAERICDLVNALTRGEGGLVHITGAEGTGKTRLLHLVHEQAKALGIPVYHTDISRADGATNALVELAKKVALELGTKAPPQLETAIRRFSEGEGKLQGDLRYQLYDGVHDGLRTLLQDGPRIIALDDLQDAHPLLIELLGYLVRSIVVRDEEPLLVAISSRADRNAPGLEGMKNEEEWGVKPISVALQPFTFEETSELVAGLLAEEAPRASLASRLQVETQGNPFFVAEFLRSLMQQGLLRPGAEGFTLALEGAELADGHLEIPAGIRQVVVRRLDPLSEGAREVVRAVAIAGREIELELLLDVLDDDEEELLDWIDGLVEEGILVERRTGVRVLYDFAHKKVREVAEEAMEDEDRARLHRRMGAALEVRHAQSPMSAEAIGEHYRKAGDHGKAFKYLVVAAVRMWERSLAHEAWELTERAASLDRAARDLLAFPEYKRSLIDMLTIRADALANHGDLDDARKTLVTLLREGKGFLDDARMGQAELRMGSLLTQTGRHAEARETLEKVRHEAQARGDRALLIESLLLLASLAWMVGDIDGAERLANEALVLSTDSRHEELRARILVVITAVQGVRGQLAAATTGLTEAEGILRGLRNKRHRCLALCNLAEVLSWQGEIGMALQRADDAMALARDVLFRAGEAFGHRVRASVLLDIGDHRGAAKELKACLKICRQIGTPVLGPAHLLCARLALFEERPGRAITHLRAGLGALREQDPENYTPLLNAMLALARAASGKPDIAQALAELAFKSVPSLGVPARCQVLLALAETSATLGSRSRAVELAREVSHLASSRGLRVWAMEARLLIVRLGRTEEAGRARVEADELARGLLRSIPSALAPSFQERPGIKEILA